MQKNSLFEETAKVFGTPNREKEEIAAAGEKIIAILICLNTTRLQMFTEKVTKSVIAVTPEKTSPYVDCHTVSQLPHLPPSTGMERGRFKSTRMVMARTG